MEILYRDLATRTPVKILNSDLSLRSLTGNFCGDLLYRTCTDSRLPYKGILPSSFYREPVREILQTIFYRDFRKRNLQNLNSHLFLMFLATLFGVSCQNIFFKTIFIIQKYQNHIHSFWCCRSGQESAEEDEEEEDVILSRGNFCGGSPPPKKLCNNNPTTSCNSKCIMRVTHRVRGNNQYNPNISKNEGVLSLKILFCGKEPENQKQVDDVGNPINEPHFWTVNTTNFW